MHIQRDQIDSQLLIAVIDDQINSPLVDNNEGVAEIEHQTKLDVRGLIVDCAAVHYLTTVGIGVLIKLHKRMIRRNGHLKLIGLTDLVHDEITTLHLDRIFEIHEDLVEARKALAMG